jgi:hypothetical protein
MPHPKAAGSGFDANLSCLLILIAAGHFEEHRVRVHGTRLDAHYPQAPFNVGVEIHLHLALNVGVIMAPVTCSPLFLSLVRGPFHVVIPQEMLACGKNVYGSCEDLDNCSSRTVVLVQVFQFEGLARMQVGIVRTALSMLVKSDLRRESKHLAGSKCPAGH